MFTLRFCNEVLRFGTVFAVMLIFNSRIKKKKKNWVRDISLAMRRKILREDSFDVCRNARWRSLFVYSFGKQIFTLSQAILLRASETYLMSAIRKGVRDDKGKTARRSCFEQKFTHRVISRKSHVQYPLIFLNKYLKYF